jgi:hypothetical protein
MDQEKYTSITPYAEETDRIRVYVALEKIKICDFVKIMLDEWVEKHHPEYKNLPIGGKRQ